MSEEEPSDEELQASRVHALNKAGHFVCLLLYYDRKGDEDLPVGRIELLIKRGMLTREAIVEAFRAELFSTLDRILPP